MGGKCSQRGRRRPALERPSTTPMQPPLFLLSFRHRDELAVLAERGGWKAIAARRGDGVERRFVASGASIALIDARGAYQDGLDAVRVVADAVEANAAALLVLVSRTDVAGLDAIFAAGATHYLASPFGETELLQALRFAARHAERLAGGHRAASGRAALVEGEATAWRWQPGARSVELSPTMARRFDLPAGREAEPVTAMFRRLDRTGRRVTREAIARLLGDGKPTGFAHMFGGARVAHHVSLDQDGTVIGRVEDIDDTATLAGPRTRDPLTGAEDGQGLRRWLQPRLRGGAPGSIGCILILVSVSRFDAINAAFGKAAGDTVLQAVARRIERLVSGAGARNRIVARIAGAEFAVGLGAPVSLDAASLLAAQILEAVSRSFVSDHRLITLSCRIGIAVADDEEREADALLRRASAALAEARGSDAGAIRIRASADEAETGQQGRLETDLRTALERDEIEVLFQPQVAITTGRIVGVEALARWRHPDLGELGAETLFAAAERSDYLLQLSDHVQRKAVMIATCWPDEMAHLRLAVNITAGDIAQPGFADRFLAIIAGFDAGRLTVEVTEGGLIEDLGEAAALLSTLRAAGLRVAIDDFGTGYSSLAYLKALPLDYLKIDRRLAQDITGSPRDRVVVRGVIEMARSLGLGVVAEGVETEEQLALLAAEGCNYYQGFLCSPPVDSTTLARLVAAQA
jgi:diguanylate cyclase (GGDEF)-like protein